MFDIDHFVAHYTCPELSLVPDSGFPVCCGERGSFNGELTANDIVSERLISLSCDCGLYSVSNIAEAVVLDAPRIKELISSKKSSVTGGTNADRRWRACMETYSLRHNSSWCITKRWKQCIDDSL